MCGNLIWGWLVIVACGAGMALGQVTEISREQFRNLTEREEKAKEEARGNKGFFIRFPWAKKGEESKSNTPAAEKTSAIPVPVASSASRQSTEEKSETTSEVADPFGPAAYPETPAYHNLESLSQAPPQASSVTPQVASRVTPETEIPSSANLPDIVTGVSGVSAAPQVSAVPENPVLRQIPEVQASTEKLGGEDIRFYSYGQTIAQVGSQVILAGDIMGSVEHILEENKDKIPPQAYAMQREIIIRSLLAQSIESKLIFCDILRSLPGDGLKSQIAVIDKIFMEEEVPRRMKERNLKLLEDYEKALNAEGMTLQKQKYMFREIVLCQQWLQQHVQVSTDVSPAEIADYYREHSSEFETQPRARWEELVIRKSRFHDRNDAYREIVRIGSMVAVGKKPFSEVAREFSHGVTASSGGEHQWIKPGELASKPLDEAIFSQPVGKLSPHILEDDQCFYIVRVLEREELKRKPFVDAQVEIRQKIIEAKRTAMKEEYLAKLRKEIPVLTVFDGVPTPQERLEQARKAQGGMPHSQGFGGFGKM